MATTPPASVTTPTAAVPYSGTGAAPLATIQGPSATAPDPNSVGQNVWPALPPGLSNNEFKGMSNGTPATKKGFGKGEHDPNLTKIGDLIRIVSAVHSGDYTGVNVNALENVLKTGKLPGIWDAQSMVNGGYAEIPNDVDKTIVATAWKQLMQVLPSQGIGTAPGDRTPPSMQQIPEAIHQIGLLPLAPQTISHLEQQGRNTSQLSLVRDLVKQNDQLAQGAPGAWAASPGKQGAPDFQSGKDYYKQMMNAYLAQNKQGQDLTLNLNALGMLDITNATPTGKQVGQAVQKLMKAAYAAGMSPAEYQAQALTNPTKYGLPDRTESVDTAYVQHIADQVGVKLSPADLVSTANALSQMPTGVDTEDWVAHAVTAAAVHHIQNNPSLDISDFSGMTLGIAENIRAVYASQGVAITPQALNAAVAKTLQSGPTTVYAANEVAQAVGSNAARTAAATQYKSLAPMINQDTSVSSIAAPYLATAEKTLGISASTMNLTNPQWMKWASGGQNGDELMSQSDWAHTLMTDPQYGFLTSKPEENLQAAGAGGILEALGMTPGSNTFSSASTSNLTTPTGG